MTAPTRRPPVLRAGPRLAARAKAERAQRRRTWARRGGLLLLGLLLLAAVGWTVTSTSLLAVRSVRIEGAQRVTVAQLQQVAAVRLQTPLARLDVTGIAARVRQLDGIASVQVSRGWPSTLHITVVERQPVATVRRSGGWAYIDSAGTPFFTLPRQPPGLAVLDVPSVEPPDQATRSALAVLVSLPAALRQQVASVRAPTPSGVVLILAAGQLINWGPPGDAADRAAAVRALLARGERRIDVSSPGVATTSPG